MNVIQKRAEAAGSVVPQGRAGDRETILAFVAWQKAGVK